MAGSGSSSEDEGGSHSGGSGDEAPKAPRKVHAPARHWGGWSRGGHGTPNSLLLSPAGTHSHPLCPFPPPWPTFPPQRPQTKAKPPQAAGPSSPQRPPTPEETKPASSGAQEDNDDTEVEQAGPSLREEGLGAWTPGSEGGGAEDPDSLI